MKQTILTIFFAIIALGASAQSPISFQVKAGVGTSNFYGENVESDTRIAYKVGVGMNYELNRTWVFQPSLNFVSIGAREEVEYVGKVNMNELYIQLPIMMARPPQPWKELQCFLECRSVYCLWHRRKDIR